MDQLEQEAMMRLAHNKSLHIGPFLLAGLLDCLFCGFLLMQCGRYLRSSREDPLLCKLAVGYVMLMNIGGSLLTSVWVYDLFVYHFGTYHMFLSTKYVKEFPVDYVAIPLTKKQISWFFINNSTTVVVVQAFFGWRAWRLMNRNMFVAATIAVLVLGALAGGIAIKVVCSTLGDVINPAGVRIPAYICMSCTVAADGIITSIILYYIYKNRKKGSLQTTQILGRVARITFESQLPPTIAACTLSLIYLVNRDGFLIVPILVVKLKSYGISFLHTLNSREAWKQPEPVIANQTCKLDTQWATNATFSNAPSPDPYTPQEFAVQVSVVRVVTEEGDDLDVVVGSEKPGFGLPQSI
ncbi:hypothetical protein FRC10_012208 [Ceratobasidium sp. 414]|nr:hypothetical protein FRC10_012208 [Ceratobasidium sp. 414]